MNLKVIFIAIVFLFLGSTLSQADTTLPLKEAEEFDFAQGLLSRGLYDQAIEQYHKFIANYPQSNFLQDAYLAIGEGYFLSQDLDKARDAFNQFKKLFPHSNQIPLSSLRLGQIALQEKEYDNAIKELTSISTTPELQKDKLQAVYFYLAHAYAGKNDDSSALDFLQKATQVKEASFYTAVAYKEMGQMEAHKGQYDLAMESYAKAMAQKADEALKIELIYRMAEAQFMALRYEEALKGFEKVIDEHPGSVFEKDALANMLLAFFNLGKYEALLDEYQKHIAQIKEDNTYFQIHFSAVLAFIELKQFDKANAFLDRALALPGLKTTEMARVFIKKADILIREKRYKDGLALLEGYSSQNVDHPDENLFLKARAYYGLGEFEKAFNLYQNVRINFPNSYFVKAAFLGEAYALKEQGRAQEAEALFLKNYDIQDTPALKKEALYEAVMAALKAFDLKGVIQTASDYLKAYPQDDSSSDVLFALADAYQRNSQAQDAIKLLEGYLAQATVAKPNTAYFLLGFYAQSAGDNEKALAYYARVEKTKEAGNFYLGAIKNTAMIYLNQKNDEKARAYFDRLITEAGPNDLQMDTYIWVCNQFLKGQKYEDVLRVAGQAEKKFPSADLQEIEYFKAEAFRGMGRCDEANKVYIVVAQSKAKNAYTGSAHIGLGLCLGSVRHFDEARKEFKKVLEENADDYTLTVHARFEEARVDENQKDFNSALKLYLLIASIYDDDHYCSESLLGAAKIYERFTQKTNALKLYHEILERYKTTTAASVAAERVRSLK
ncbi:MAG: tetratricopeptide repeat protein [Candidatus Omnitrophica bacterium]|nr:tetratricopeptide repeat protein [Candidatus Omnitrophota bacterium]